MGRFKTLPVFSCEMPKKCPGETILAHHRENLGGQPGSSFTQETKNRCMGHFEHGILVG